MFIYVFLFFLYICVLDNVVYNFLRFISLYFFFWKLFILEIFDELFGEFFGFILSFEVLMEVFLVFDRVLLYEEFDVEFVIFLFVCGIFFVFFVYFCILVKGFFFCFFLYIVFFFFFGILDKNFVDIKFEFCFYSIFIVENMLVFNFMLFLISYILCKGLYSFFLKILRKF